ncbi:hypothetical protein [Novosphingobium sp.]|uniref:hypothetical protein n=1 Tax=Novosphingobium sp. TaxID=1874826 RepID=UPI00286AFE0C|nr:hypothetical protein [Novosphingobium sp.]
MTTSGLIIPSSCNTIGEENTVKRISAIAAALAGALTLMSGPLQAQSGNVYFYCYLVDGTHSTVYYTGVFEGYYGNNSRFSNEFTDYIHDAYAGTIGTADCYTRHSYSDASSEKSQTRSSKLRVYRDAVDTGWTP